MRYNCKLITSLLCGIFAGIITANAQNVMTGTAVSSEGVPADSANVVLLDGESGLILWEGATSRDGSFQIPAGDYSDSSTLNVLHYEYGIYTGKLGDMTFPVRIVLSGMEYTLGDAVVSAMAPLIKFEKGDLIVAVDQVRHHERLYVDDLLKRIPGVDVSKSGIALYGKNAEIYINGVKQSIGIEAVMHYIESLPANAIKTLKLVPMPSNKYGNAEAVIDIQMKTSMPEGLSSSSRLYGGMLGKEFGDGGASEFVMFRKGRTTFNTMLSYDNYNEWSESEDSSWFANAGKYILNNTDTEGRRDAIRSSSNLTVNLAEGHTLDFNAFIYWDNGRNKNMWSSAGDDYKDEYMSKTKSNSDLYSLTAKYSGELGGGTSISAYYSGMYGTDKSRGNYYLSALPEPDARYLHTDYAMAGQQHFLVFDGTSRLGDRWELAYGLRSSFGFITDDTENSIPGGAETDLKSINFKGKEIIAGAYAKARFNITENHGLSLDLGYDYTWFDYEGVGDDFHRRSGNFVPKFRYWLNVPNYSLNFIAWNYLARPHYTRMLPGIRYVNDYYYTVGNPSLKNNVEYNFELMQTFLGFMTVDAIYSVQSAVMDSYYGVDDELQMAYKSYINEAQMNLLRLTLSVPFQLNWFYGEIRGVYNYVQFHDVDPKLGVGDYSEYHSGDVRANLYFDITDRFTYDCSFIYSSHVINLQTEITDYMNLNMGLSYAFLKKKNLIATFNAYNIIPSIAETRRTSRFDGNLLSRFSHIRPIFEIGIKYNFDMGLEVNYKDNMGDFTRLMK